MYPAELVAPMRADLTNNGFTELTDAEQVNNALSSAEGTSLLVVNSVCGCAAGSCRPGAVSSLNGDKKPNNLYTVFAGVDAEAVAAAREHLLPYPPSSPSIGVFKDGELVHFVERHHIEGRSADMISSHLQQVYKEFC
jgi:putative YphP/YqiW family bacilliredoxin